MTAERKLCLSGKGLTKVFGFGRSKTVAVDHVDFDFHEGEVISIVGESGSGKTTLAKMLLGLINTTEGEIYFQGQKRDISSREEEAGILEKYPGDLSGSRSRAYNTFHKIDAVLLDCIRMRGGGNLPHDEESRDDEGSVQLRQPEVRRADQQISVRAFGRADAALDDRPHLPAEAQDPDGR